MSRILPVDPDRPDPACVREAAAAIRSGKLVVLPTDTLYGLGTNALDEEAVRKVYQVKQRPLSKPLLILIGEEEALPALIEALPPLAERLMRAFWPGPLTLVFPASSRVLPILRGGSPGIAIRLPALPLIQSLVREAGVPITGTSANLSDRPTPPTAQGVLEELGAGVDLVLDGGPCTSQKGSTLIDLTQSVPRLLREGEISREAIEEQIGPVGW
ncbi:MAG: threonylcarbamoyl-AMP synthase [Candidatus Tectomicrobia bacterium]|uniref:L-threonylcarbamoyladenylate synthase n=1 Tax=Tectimicrobiota bacterium TaxID=2528274 RepID=A0A932CLW9_UNCTE|nr:threonylcarbamoyl-AMP synthase [Candidatus Tectomicrobia bacterium]